MRGIPLVRSSLLRPLLEFLARTQNVLPPTLVRARRALGELDPPVPLAFAGALFDEAVRATGYEDLGLRVGHASALEDFGEFGRVVRADTTVATAFSTAARLMWRFNSGESFWIVEQGDTVCLHRWFSPVLRRGRQPLSDYGLAFMLQLLRLAAGRRWRPQRIDFEGPKPGHAPQLEALADLVRFEQPAAALWFSRDVLSLRLPQDAAPRRNGEKASVCAPVLPRDLGGSVRSALSTLLQIGRPDLSGLAESAGMSARSFQRRLSESGLCFTRLLDEARFERARELLQVETARVVDVGADLGYTDAGNFSRAFRRWSGGLTPQQFRRSR